MVIIKDKADALLTLLIFLLPTLIRQISTPLPYKDLLVDLLLLTLIGLNLINAITYNKFDQTKSSLSIIGRAIISFILTEGIVYIFNKQISLYWEIALTLLIIGTYIHIAKHLSSTTARLDGTYRLTLTYQIGEKLFLYGAILYGGFILFSGRGILLALEVIFIGWLMKTFFKFFSSMAVKDHIRDLIEVFGDKASNYEILYIPEKVPNAFAFFAGDRRGIGITDGFVKKFNVSEINFAIAHEFAHHMKNHVVIRIAAELTQKLGLYLFSMLKIFLPVTILIGGLSQILKKAYYKDREYEADEVALGLLLQAGLNPIGAITFFEKIIAERKEKGGFLEKLFHIFLEDHPYSEDRLERLRSLMEMAKKQKS
ncbi:MAG: M48 family metalloprotease [Candidatus Kryptonium sp.]